LLNRIGPIGSPDKYHLDLALLPTNRKMNIE
jgi:hypothetical protein